MKREYKFRAWDVDMKQMVYSSEQENLFCFVKNGWWCNYGNNFYVGTKKQTDKEHDDFLMQYTGLKDVYESDIIAHMGYNYEVLFSQGSFGIDMDGEWINLYDIYKIVVIGNSKENPELL